MLSRYTTGRSFRQDSNLRIATLRRGGRIRYTEGSLRGDSNPHYTRF